MILNLIFMSTSSYYYLAYVKECVAKLVLHEGIYFHTNATIYSISLIVTVIGFSQSHYTSKESEEAVNVTVTVQEGVLDKSVTISLMTLDGTAKSKILMKHIKVKLHSTYFRWE